jgi:hypothetical protein
MFPQRIRDGLFAGGVHLLFSVIVLSCVYILVKRTWFIQPWGQLMDGSSLLLMVIGIDVICGPLLTGLVVHSAKARWKNLLDITVIACIQFAALGYGLWTAWQAKPSWLIFETDRFVVVRLADLQAPDSEDVLKKPKPAFAGLQLKAVSKLSPDDPSFLSSLNLSLQGIPPAYRPERWVDYSANSLDVIKSAQRQPTWLERIRVGEFIAHPLQPGAELGNLSSFIFVPLQVGWHTDWVVLVDHASLQPLAVMRADAWSSAPK